MPTDNYSFENKAIVDAYGARPVYARKAIEFLISNGLLRQNDHIADIGTGNARVIKSIFNANSGIPFNFYGIDTSLPMLEKARQQFPYIGFGQGSFEDMFFSNHTMDVIIGGDSWHWGHTNFPQSLQTTDEVKRVLKPNGRIINLISNWTKRDGDNLSDVLIKIKRDLSSAFVSSNYDALAQSHNQTKDPWDDDKEIIIPSLVVANSLLTANMGRMFDLSDLSKIFGATFVETKEYPLDVPKGELVSQIYFSSLPMDRQLEIFESINRAAKPNQNGMVTLARKTIVFAGYVAP